MSINNDGNRSLCLGEKKERYQANDIDSEYRSFKLNDAVEKKKWWLNSENSKSLLSFSTSHSAGSHFAFINQIFYWQI